MMLKDEKNEVKLVSAVDIDYSKLQNLLASKKWQEADRETAILMLRGAKREEKGWLNRETLEEFPYEDLQAIDQLWVKYSNGHFGFSVQQRIYEYVRENSKDHSKVWEIFRYMVGWIKKGEKFQYSDINFSQKAPEAHLPVVSLFVGFMGVETESESFEQRCAVMAGLGGTVFNAIGSRLLKSHN
jgi:eukaryotic-like serine/threonine-protein kinase